MEKAVRADDYVYEEHGSDYIPGYAEIVKANEIARDPLLTQAEKQRYFQRWHAVPQHLPIEFVWLRLTSPSGGPSYNADVDRTHYMQRGFKTCTREDFERLKEQIPNLDYPPAASVSADGLIRRMDTALFYADVQDPRYLAYQSWLAEENRRALEATPNTGLSGVHLDVVENRREQFEKVSLE